MFSSVYFTQVAHGVRDGNSCGYIYLFFFVCFPRNNSFIHQLDCKNEFKVHETTGNLDQRKGEENSISLLYYMSLHFPLI